MTETITPAEFRAAVALNEVADELKRAMGKFGPFASAHEGYAVILEEVDELWQEVKHGTRARAREEAVQVAAMALRFLVDVPAESTNVARTACGHPVDHRCIECATDDELRASVPPFPG